MIGHRYYSRQTADRKRSHAHVFSVITVLHNWALVSPGGLIIERIMGKDLPAMCATVIVAKTN